MLKRNRLHLSKVICVIHLPSRGSAILQMSLILLLTEVEGLAKRSVPRHLLGSVGSMSESRSRRSGMHKDLRDVVEDQLRSAVAWLPRTISLEHPFAHKWVCEATF